MYEFRCEIFEPEDEVIDLPDGLTDKNGEDVEDGIITEWSSNYFTDGER